MNWALMLWMSFGVLFYAYAGYPLLLKLFAAKAKTESDPSAAFPAVTILIAAYNEAEWIVQKIQNCFLLNYPSELLQVIVVDDGSTDHTAMLVQQEKNVRLIRHEKRGGKSAALNTGMAQVKTPIVVFSDANCMLQKDALMQLMPFFQDASVGGVAGQKRVHLQRSNPSPAIAEAAYWHYESWVKQLESSFYTLAGATGELLAIRSELFRAIPENIITDDFYISMQLQSAHKKLKYAHYAIAEEFASQRIADEWERKKRISAGAFQSLYHFAEHLYPFRDARFAFQFFSHRVLRWVFCAPALIVFFIAGGMMWFTAHHLFYQILFHLQLVFLMLSFFGFLGMRRAGSIFSFPFYFLFMHAAMIAGFFTLITGKQTVFWNKASR